MVDLTDSTVLEETVFIFQIKCRSVSKIYLSGEREALQGLVGTSHS
jgi:hypothetical protein